MEFTIYGPVPSKKNSRINTRSGRSFPSKNYSAWEKDALAQVIEQKIPPVTEYPTTITAKFFFETLRKCDLSNKFESLADMLVKAGVLEDDNYTCIDQIVLEYGGHDKNNPRIEVIIVT